MCFIRSSFLDLKRLRRNALLRSQYSAPSVIQPRGILACEILGEQPLKIIELDDDERRSCIEEYPLLAGALKPSNDSSANTNGRNALHRKPVKWPKTGKQSPKRSLKPKPR